TATSTYLPHLATHRKTHRYNRACSSEFPFQVSCLDPSETTMRIVLRRLAAAGVALFLLMGWVHGGEPGVAGKVAAVHGTLLERSETGWQALKAGSPVKGGATLVALFAADLRSPNDAVELRLVADVGERGPLPVLEAGVTLRPTSAADLDVAIERGVVLLT